MTLRNTIPVNDSDHFLITDIVTTYTETNAEAFVCLSDLSRQQTELGYWYLHPTQQSIEEEDKIDGKIDRGWHRDRAISGDMRIVRLDKKSDAAEEGVFTCHFAGDINSPVSVGIYYPSEST